MAMKHGSASIHFEIDLSLRQLWELQVGFREPPLDLKNTYSLSIPQLKTGTVDESMVCLLWVTPELVRAVSDMQLYVLATGRVAIEEYVAANWDSDSDEPFIGSTIRVTPTHVSFKAVRANNCPSTDVCSMSLRIETFMSVLEAKDRAIDIPAPCGYAWDGDRLLVSPHLDFNDVLDMKLSSFKLNGLVSNPAPPLNN